MVVRDIIFGDFSKDFGLDGYGFYGNSMDSFDFLKIIPLQLNSLPTEPKRSSIAFIVSSSHLQGSRP